MGAVPVVVTWTRWVAMGVPVSVGVATMETVLAVAGGSRTLALKLVPLVIVAVWALTVALVTGALVWPAMVVGVLLLV